MAEDLEVGHPSRSDRGGAARSAAFGAEQPDGFGRATQYVITLVPLIASFFSFCGNGYYGRLFREFGLKPGLLDRSQIDIATMGFYSVLFAWYTIIRENAWLWIRCAIAGIAIGAAIVLVLRYMPRLLELSDRLAPLANSMDRLNRKSFKWLAGGMFLLAGLGAGDLAGSYDANAAQAVRSNAPNCYVIDGVPYKALLLAQDNTRTVLVHSDRTSLVNNDRLSFVTACLDLPSRMQPLTKRPTK